MATDLDLTFNSPNGFVSTDFGVNTPPQNFGYSIVIQPDGKIVMAGNTYDGNLGFNIVAISRYNTDGTLDITFGTLGKNTATIQNNSVTCYSVGLQSTGKIVVCGVYATSFNNIFLARFTSNGALDGSFGGGFGYVITAASAFGPVTFNNGNCMSYSLAIQSDDKIVVGGEVENPTTNFIYFGLARYTATTGGLDGTFGTSGTVAQLFNNTDDEAGNSVAIQSDGKILLGGNVRTHNGSNFRFAVSRYSTSGAVDTTFGVNGLVTISQFLPGSLDFCSSIKIQSNGYIVLGGNITKSTGENCNAIARFNTTTNTIDLTFGTNGKVITDLSSSSTNLTCNSIALQTDDKIVLAGYYTVNPSSVTSESFSLARYNTTDGSLDTTFGISGTGLVLTDLVALPFKERGQSVAIQPDGKVLVGGTQGTFDDSDIYYFMLARYFGFPPYPPPVVPICFPAGTPVKTDQGNIAIEKIDPAVNTIHNKPIVAITQSYMDEDTIVCIEKHALGINIPNKKTYISNYHGIVYNNKLIPAKQFVGRLRGVHNVKYDKEVLYNVLMEKHYIINVNNMRVETLNPKNIVAKLYTNECSPEQKERIILEINETTRKNKINRNYERINGYENISHNTTRRKFSILRFNPLISRFNFHTKRHFVPHYNSHTNKYRVSNLRNNAMVKINTHTFRHGRRRR